jgi:hypothetical protein
MNTNYWVVGAMWGGRDEALPHFLERGYWYCYDPKGTPSDVSSQVKAQQELFKQIKKGDRIAVKKKNIHTQEATIRAIGIVKATDLDEWRIYIDWLPLGELGEKEIKNRKVPLNNLQESIHGPFKNDNEWIRQIFCV